MTQETFNQIIDSARHGDVFAQAVLGNLLCEGKVVQKNIEHGLGWLNNAAQCNCLWAKEMYDEYSKNGYQSSPSQSQQAEVDYRQELNNLIGLSRVKTDIDSLRNLIRIQAMRQQNGLSNTSVSYHCVFTGNPGTGKTTVARIVAGIYKELGILTKGHLVEVDRSKLVAEYVGQTAVKTNKVIDEALDGVLFIDEAYTLVGGENDFGSEAIATLLKRMEDDRDRLVVILAGYTNEIKGFIDSNPGLQSRFNRYIQFDDYSIEELVSIFKYNLRKSQYKIKRDALDEVQRIITNDINRKDKHFGNARYCRNLFEKIIQNQANRLARLQSIDNEQLVIITKEDINV